MLPPSFLEQFVVGEVFAYLMIFARVGAAIMIMPGIGESYVSPRIRLSFALAFALVLTPAFSQYIPDPSDEFLQTVLLLAGEITTGFFIGLISRMLFSTLHITGTIIAYQSSLAMAAMFDTTQNAQSTVIGNFLTIIALIVIFALDIHHVMLAGVADSYILFPPGEFAPTQDMADFLARTLGTAFLIAFQLSAAHITFSLIFYVGAGVLARLMPTMQVFFVLMPAQIAVGFFLLMALLQSIMLVYAGYVEDTLISFMDY
ncbi:MAG: flagellar biosynthetic protein FliR [Rickettsiales bacterium]|nr:flagellar biosynthetic protein FliR [Rickettsiales bacterium]